MKEIAFIALILFSTVTFSSTNETSQETEINLVISYNSYGGGDIVFKLLDPAPICRDGYWFTKSDVGFQANLSMVLSGHAAKSKVKVTGITNQAWAGSSGAFCKIYNIQFVP